MKRYKYKIGPFKIWSKPNKHEFYPIEWKNGYVMAWTEWNQIRYKRFNWITFVVVEFEIERQLGDGFILRLGLLGFRLEFHSLWNFSVFYKQLAKDAKQAKKDIKTGKLKPIVLKDR